MKNLIFALITLTLCIAAARAADDTSPKITFSGDKVTFSGEKATLDDSRQFWGYPYTLEQAKRFGYFMPSWAYYNTFHGQSENDLFKLAQSGDATIIRRLTQLVINGDGPERALPFGAKLAADHENTFLLNEIGHLMLGEGRLDVALIAYTVAANVGDPQSREMAHGMQNELGPERSKTALDQADALIRKYASEAGYPDLRSETLVLGQR